MFRFTARLLCIVASFLIIVAGCFFYNNNRTVPKPSQEEFKSSLEKSIQWIVANKAQILTKKNSVLWWMLGESAKLTGDQRLQQIVDTYIEELPVSSPWQYFFNPNSLAPLRDEMLTQLPDYNILFLYGLSCDKGLAQLEITQKQLKANFCNEYHPISPACVTHQLMGVRFMQRRDCGDQGKNEILMSQLQEQIENQLIWDPRILDVYIQRVLMLVESGVPQRIKPIWLRNVIDAQNKDGGWDGFHPLIPLGEKRSFGLGKKFFTIARPKSTLHATAQGVFLMSILTSQKDHVSP